MVLTFIDRWLLVRVGLLCTVKPVLTTTSEQRPPVNNGQNKYDQANFDTNFDWKTSAERPPMYKGHFLGVPRVGIVDRFDWTSNFFFKLMLFN
jgi:hypothetical protein